jgi:TolB-like protein/Tfp pilus assembly protein PilF/DNA-binding winged helix-turn-helix (wHTH) protein
MPRPDSQTYHLDLKRYELRRADGLTLKLERQPMELLIFLAQRRGELVTREEIAAALWADGVFVDTERGINNAIRKIRIALHDSPDEPTQLQTVVGKGYRFIGQLEMLGGPTSLLTEAAPAVSDSRAASLAPQAQSPGRRSLVSAGIAIAAIFLVAGLAVWRSRASASRAAIHSLAVLPLENLTGDPAQEYFADGMTEALTTELAQISSLKVISRTSVMQYKGTKKPLPQIGRELAVDAVIEGAVQRSGDKVGITVQLVHAPSDRHLWAKSYERSMSDVLELQRDAAHAIADEIKAKLTPSENVHLASAHSIDSQAYDDYLKGRFSLEKGNARKSIEYFQSAIQKHPNDALAYAGLANSYITLGQPWGGDMSPKEVLPQAKAAATRALKIDDSLGEAHLALARIIQLYDWDWPAVETEYRRALELNPNDAMARNWYGEYLQEMGRNEEAFVQMRQAMMLDPLSAGSASELGYIFYTARQYDQAIHAFHKALDLEPDYIEAHVGLGWVYDEKKMYGEAIAELEKAANLGNRHDLIVASLGQVLGDSGRRQEARRLLKELEERSAHRYISPCLIALVQIGLGENDRALASLEQGYAARDQWMLYLNVDPHLDDLRSDPRFKDLLRRVGLPSRN